MMKPTAAVCIRSTTIALLMLVTLACRAEDIDIFGRPPGANDLPNVLIVWDSSANWSANLGVPDCKYWEDGVPTTDGPKSTSPDKEQGTKFAIEKCAIYNVIDALQPQLASDPPRFNIGLMLFNESGAPQGGYARRQFLPLTRGNAAPQHRAQQLVRRLHHLVGIKLGDVRKVAHLGDHQLEHPGGRAVIQLAPPIGQHTAQQVCGAALKAGGELDALGNAGRQVVADHRLEQFFLAGVVQVERALGHAGALGHLVGAGGGKAFFDKQRQGGVQQLLRACLFAAAPVGDVGGRHGY